MPLPIHLPIGVLDALPEAQLVVDREGLVLHANRAAAALFGRAADCLAGHPLHALVDDGDAHCHALLRQGARSAQPTPGRLRLRIEGGAVAPCRCEIAALPAVDGLPAGGLWLRLQPSASASRRFLLLNERLDALAREVERRRAAEAALREQREWLRVVLRSIGDAVIATDTAGAVVFMNPVAEALTGWPADEAAGRPLVEVFPIINHDSRQPVPSPVEIALRERRIVGLANHTLLIARDGSEHPIDDAAAPIVDDAGRLRGVVLVFRAIAERVRAERERRRLEQQLRDAQKMEAIGTLAGGIAHDFNNVLGAVIANAALAQDVLAPGHPAAMPLAQIGRATRRARALVGQILAFSRKQPQQLRRQVLQPLVEEAAALLRGTLPRVVQLELRLDAAPVVALVDATQFEQVLLNLCTNAWHALRGGSGRIVVTLEQVTVVDGVPGLAPGFGPWLAGACVRLSVADNGCGMDEPTRQRIFEPFFTTKPHGEGTGLGLAVVHGIVAEHRGALAVQSAPGAGSTFAVYLPPASAADLEPAPLPSLPEAGSAIGQGRHVAYVDDDEIMRITVEALLQRAGYRVSGFADGALALAAIGTAPEAFDAVVTDFNMPVLSGIDVARALQRLRPQLPVIITSGYLSDDLRVDARRLGIAGLLRKEETLERIVGMVGDLLDDGGPAP